MDAEKLTTAGIIITCIILVIWLTWKMDDLRQELITRILNNKGHEINDRDV